MKGSIAGRSGDKQGGLDAIGEIEKKWLAATDLNDIAFIYHALGDLDSHFAYFNRATDHHTLRCMYIMYCRLLENGRDDPRYEAVVQKLRGTYLRTWAISSETAEGWPERPRAEA